MALKILLTFKESEKWLYDEIMKHSSHGGWIKDILKKHLGEGAERRPETVKKEDGGMLDF